jgi:hypothetical protein
MIRRIGLVGLATTLVFASLMLAVASPADAATGYVADETLSTASTNAPALAMAPNGYAVVAWIERPSGQVVRVSVRPPGGWWSAPQSLPVGLDSANDLGVAIASSGAAAIAWEEVTSPSTFQFAVATRLPGGTFGAPDILREGVQTFSPAVGIDAAGTVTLLYAPSPDTVVREFAVGSSALAARPETLTAGCAAFGQQLAVGPSGEAVAGYHCSGAVFALRQGGRWAVSPTISDSFPPGPCMSTVSNDVASVAIDGTGEPVGVLQRTSTQRLDIGFCETISTTVDASLVLPLGGLMTAVPGAPAATGTAFGGFGFPISGPRAAISPAGIVFAWADTANLGRAQQQVRFYSVDGNGGSAPQPVGTESAGAGLPALAAAADGRALLAWVQLDRPGGTLRLLAAERPPGGAFGDPVPIDTGDASSSAVAMTDAGDGLAAWIAGTAAPYAVHARGFDASPPTLSGMAIPTRATVGAPAAFAAAPFDVWGPVTTSWSFGDGGTASGAAVTHAYVSAGAYTASMTATDAVGNAVTSSATVQVLAAEGPVVSSLSLTHRRFRVGRARMAISARRRGGGRRAPVGTTIRFTLDRAASVRIGIERPLPGVRVGRRCVAPSRRSRGHRRCQRVVVILPMLTRTARAGPNAVRFSGRIGRRALPPGRYRARLTATAAGRSGAPRRIAFRVVR